MKHRRRCTVANVLERKRSTARVEHVRVEKCSPTVSCDRLRCPAPPLVRNGCCGAQWRLVPPAGSLAAERQRIDSKIICVCLQRLAVHPRRQSPSLDIVENHIEVATDQHGLHESLGVRQRPLVFAAKVHLDPATASTSQRPAGSGEPIVGTVHQV